MKLNVFTHKGQVVPSRAMRLLGVVRVIRRNVPLASFRLNTLLLLLAFCLWTVLLSDVTVAQSDSVRKWQDSTGKFAVEAVLVSQTKTKVTLRTVEGKRIVVPMNRLSKIDRDYLESNKNLREEETQARRNTQARQNTKAVDLQKDTQAAIEQRLAGPPLQAQDSAADQLQELLQLPVYVDRRSLEDVGTDWQQPLKLSGNHATLRDQLYAALVEEDLDFYCTQTMVVIYAEPRRNPHLEIRFYRIPTPRFQTNSVLERIYQIETDSWTAFGGDGEVEVIGNVYAISQSRSVHRQLAKNLNCDPEPRHFDHELDSVCVSLSLKSASNAEVLTSLASHLDQTIEFSGVEAEQEAERTHIPLQLENVSAKDVLDAVTRQMYCTWVEDNNRIIVKLAKEAEKDISRKKFTLKTSQQAVGKRICNTIELCIDQGSWKSHGGKGSIKQVRNGFLVEQSGPVMRQVEQFFAELRRLN